MITVNDYDDIVENNPFLTNGISSYSFFKKSMRYSITFDLDALHNYNIPNSGCRCIVISNTETNNTMKIIREDSSIVIQELFIGQKPPTKVVTDSDKLKAVEIDFRNLVNITREQIKDHHTIRQDLENSEITFDFDSTKEFLSILLPKLKKAQINRLLKHLRKFQKKPLSLLEDPTATLFSDAKNIIQSTYTRILFGHLESSGSLIFVDSKDFKDEILGSFSIVTNSLGVDISGINFSENCQYASDFLMKIEELLSESGYHSFNLGELSDTFSLAFCKKDDFAHLESIAQKLNLEVRKW